MTPPARADEGGPAHGGTPAHQVARADAATRTADACQEPGNAGPHEKPDNPGPHEEPDNGGPREENATRAWAAMRDLVGSHSTRDRMRAALDLGRGVGRFKSLMWLAGGPMSLSGLAEAVGVDAPYATLIVDSLEERGLVERQPDPADRRRKLVTLTAAGSKAIEKLLRIEREPPPGFARLSPAELETLESLLRRIATGPGQAP